MFDSTLQWILSLKPFLESVSLVLFIVGALMAWRGGKLLEGLGVFLVGVSTLTGLFMLIDGKPNWAAGIAVTLVAVLCLLGGFDRLRNSVASMSKQSKWNVEMARRREIPIQWQDWIFHPSSAYAVVRKRRIAEEEAIRAEARSLVNDD